VETLIPHYGIEGGYLKTIIKFYTPWCPACKKYEPIFDKVSSENEGKIIFRDINIDNDKNSAIIYNIKNIPCTIVLDSGREVKRHVGLLDYETLIKFIK
jgi:thiol-disulfide isomerase/thioredoxin